jgi:adenylate cyclase
MTTLVERLDLPAVTPRARSRRDTETETVQFAQAALAAAKQEALQLAVRARYIALAVIACLLPIINPAWDQLYYVVLLGLFALIGWGQVRVGRVGVSRPELALLFCDLALLTFIAVVPNPFSSAHRPVATQYHFGNLIISSCCCRARHWPIPGALSSRSERGPPFFGWSARSGCGGSPIAIQS